jgi:hypothetical protein
MDTYQPIYDAVRSRISNCDFGHAVESALRDANLSFWTERASDNISQSFAAVTDRLNTPSAIYRPSLSIDGNQWCALYGENLQDGVVGFGDSPAEAMRAFDAAWNVKLVQEVA